MRFLPGAHDCPIVGRTPGEIHGQRIVCQIIDDWMAVFNSLERNGISYFETNEMAEARRLKCLYFDYRGDIKTLMERAADPKLFHLGV